MSLELRTNDLKFWADASSCKTRESTVLIHYYCFTVFQRLLTFRPRFLWAVHQRARVLVADLVYPPC